MINVTIEQLSKLLKTTTELHKRIGSVRHLLIISTAVCNSGFDDKSSGGGDGEFSDDFSATAAASSFTSFPPSRSPASGHKGSVFMN